LQVIRQSGPPGIEFLSDIWSYGTSTNLIFFSKLDNVPHLFDK
jgi:hypothetical protein